MNDPKILHRQSGGQIAEAFEKLQGPFAFLQMVQLGDRALVEGGLTVRDWFAGQALASGLIQPSYPEWQLKVWFGDRTALKREEIAARASYEYADAFLAQREKGGAA